MEQPHSVATAQRAALEAARVVESVFSYHGYSPHLTAALYGLREAVIALDAEELEAAVVALKGGRLPFEHPPQS
jgi:hypothetical protein